MIPGLDILVSTLAGTAGGLVNKWLERKIKADERAHELSMKTIDMEEAEAERDHATVLLDKNAKMAEAEAEWRVFEQGQVLHNADTGVSWVNAA
jgi:hypothetical protein